MNKIEVITPEVSRDIIRADSPDSLVEGLENIVRAGIENPYDDMAWSYYHGPMESLSVQMDPAFQRLLSHMGGTGIEAVPAHERTDINVRPQYYDLVRNLASRRGANSNGTTGGGFHRLKHLEESRFIAVPACNVLDTPDNADTTIRINLDDGICFDGLSLVIAMYKEGYEIETLKERHGQPTGFRDKQIGEFFVSHTLS